MKNFFAILIIIFFCFAGVAKAQQIQGIIVMATVIDGDTVPVISLPEVKVFAPLKFNSKADAIQFTKLMRQVKSVYPLARIAAFKIKEYNELIEAQAYSKSQRKAIMKMAENKLKEQFEPEIKKLTFSQGRILIKLIDRETGNTSYELISEFRGSVIAIFWQSFARIFGMNLKSEYDPYNTDRDIERIVQMIENGAL